MPAQLRLYKVFKIVELPPKLPDFTYINCLSWFPNNSILLNNVKIPLFQLSPYYLKDENGCIFENLWQGSKIYSSVGKQDQWIKNKRIWSHPAEIHIDEDGTVLSAYWPWRQKVFTNPYPVRYPNGFEGKKTCKGFITSNFQVLSYIEARKQFYVKEFARLIQLTPAFQCLKASFDSGNFNFQIADVDIPSVSSDGVSPTKELFLKYINDPTMSFGHVWVITALLLDWDIAELIK